MVLTPAELTARDANTKKEGVEEGKEAGKEIATKVFKAKLGITEGAKDPEKVAELAQAKLQGDEALKGQVTELQKELKVKTKEITKLTEKTAAIEFERGLMADMPSNLAKSLNTNEHIMLIKNNLEFDQTGVKKPGGDYYRDPVTKDVLPRKEALKMFYEKERPGLLETAAPEGGRGGGDDKGGARKFETLGQWRQDWQKKNPGKHPMGMDAQAALEAELQRNPDMKMEDAYEEAE